MRLIDIKNYHTLSAALSYAETQIKQGNIVTIKKDLDDIADTKSVFYEVTLCAENGRFINSEKITGGIVMKRTDIKWLVILCDDNTEYHTKFTKCELTNLMADCYRCLITDTDDTEFEADINKHDAANIINAET